MCVRVCVRERGCVCVQCLLTEHFVFTAWMYRDITHPCHCAHSNKYLSDLVQSARTLAMAVFAKPFRRATWLHGRLRDIGCLID